MQPYPTPSLRGDASVRFRAWTTCFHATLFLGLLALGACRDPKVTTYRVAKEPVAELPASKVVQTDAPPSAPMTLPPMSVPVASSAPMGAGGSMTMPQDSHGLQTASGASLTWTAPTTWQTKPASMMRKATFVIVGEGGATAELAVSAFPGDVGGDVANFNRWRGQVGLAPLADAAAASAIERFEANGLKFGVVDILGADPANATHMIGAMVPFDNATWFFKLTGPDAVVAKAKPAFLDFLKTVKPAPAAAP